MRNIPCVILISLLIVFSSGCKNQGNEGKVGQKLVYDRILQSGTIRAAYITYPPALMKDTKTGKMSGIFVEVLEKAAENLGLKVVWTEEVGWGSQVEALEADRCDIIGSPVWANPTRGKLTTMSIPVYYSGICAYVRMDDNRFNDNVEKVNSSKVKICTIDGETADLIARTDFSEAQRVSLPQLSSISDVLLNIKTKKADVAFVEPYFALEFLENNANSVKNITEKNPVRLFGNCYMFKKNEFQMKHMLDVAIEDLINSGFVVKVINKYKHADSFYRCANTFQAK